MDWAVPHLARADLLARRSQRRYRAFGAIMLGGSLLAVTIAATQALFFEERPELIWLEAAIMVLLLVTLVQGRRHRLHRRWLVYRSVAEQFRSALFLCAAGLGKERTDTAAGPPGYDTHAWAPRLFEELWIQRPEVTPADVGATSRFIQNTWIEDQITYNESVRDRSALADKRVRYAIGALFVATFVAAVLHAAEIHHGSHHWLELAAIVFPAAAAALHGMRAQREFLRNGERASGVLRNLRHMRTTLQAATDLTQVQAVVTSASALMLAENQDWFGSMRHHDLEIHV
jgi:hypothetical protein